MLFLLLSACGDPDTMTGARERVANHLDEHPTGTAIVRARLGDDGIESVMGTRWHGTDLAEWLAPCGLDAAPFTTALRLEPGHFPWAVLDDEGVPPCAAERLARFPFEEPSRREEVDLVVVRWHPDEAACVHLPARSTPVRTGSGVPEGLLALAPPYYRRSPSGQALRSRALHLEHGRVRIPVADAEDVVAGPLDAPEAWARHLTCQADQLDLVRLTLVIGRGVIEDLDTAPKNQCVEKRAYGEWKDWIRQQSIDGVPLRDAGRAIVVLDVPVGPW